MGKSLGLDYNTDAEPEKGNAILLPPLFPGVKPLPRENGMIMIGSDLGSSR